MGYLKIMNKDFWRLAYKYVIQFKEITRFPILRDIILKFVLMTWKSTKLLSRAPSRAKRIMCTNKYQRKEISTEQWYAK